MFLKAKRLARDRPAPPLNPLLGTAAGLLFSRAGCPHRDGLRLSSLIFALET